MRVYFALRDGSLQRCSSAAHAAQRRRSRSRYATETAYSLFDKYRIVDLPTITTCRVGFGAHADSVKIAIKAIELSRDQVAAPARERFAERRFAGGDGFGFRSSSPGADIIKNKINAAPFDERLQRCRQRGQ